MFGENTETILQMRMEELRNEAEHARLVRSMLQGKRSTSAFATMMRRTAALPGLVWQWWKTHVLHRTINQSVKQQTVISKQGVSTGM